MSIKDLNNIIIDTGPITIGRLAPDFTTLSIQGIITLSQFKGKWVVLASEPGGFAAVSTTAVIALSEQYDEFEKRNAQILVVTIDNNFANIEWIRDIYDFFKIKVPFPILEDRDANIAHKYGIVNPDRIYEQSVRDLFIINPSGKISAIITYPVSCGRNTYEILRVLDSLQLTEKYNVYTPSNWMPGYPVIVPNPHSVEEALFRMEYGANTGMNCITWFNCYKDYDSVVNPNKNNSETKTVT